MQVFTEQQFIVTTVKLKKCPKKTKIVYTNDKLTTCDPLCEIQAKVSKSNYEQASKLISTINFTIISIFDMTLLSQY